MSALIDPSAAPTQFQDPGCLGDPTLGKVPCAPTAASVYAWADYSALLASRWRGGPAGRFTHFIVWNEVLPWRRSCRAFASLGAVLSVSGTP